MIIMTINGSPYLVQKDKDGSLGWLTFLYLGGDEHRVTVYRGPVDCVTLDVKNVEGTWRYEGQLGMDEAKPYRRASHLI